jgi:hypothetical protein
MDRQASKRLWTGTKPSLHDKSKLRLFKRHTRKRIIDTTEGDVWLTIGPSGPRSKSLLADKSLKATRIKPIRHDARFPAANIVDR